MLSTEKTASLSNRFMNTEAANVLAGISLGAVGCYVPFAGSLALAQTLHLNAASVAGHDILIYIVGLVCCVIAAVTAYHARNSVKLLCALSVVTMTIVGALVSLTL